MTEYEIKRLEDRIRELWNENEGLLKENAELKKEVEKHKWNDIFLEDCADYDEKIAEEYTNLQERNKELEQQIERMKCCENCKYKNLDWHFTPVCEARDKEIENPLTCKCDKWEIRK